VEISILLEALLKRIMIDTMLDGLFFLMLALKVLI
jgi:hypothetical protein